jgi:hypothetical protein
VQYMSCIIVHACMPLMRLLLHVCVVVSMDMSMSGCMSGVLYIYAFLALRALSPYLEAAGIIKGAGGRAGYAGILIVPWKSPAGAYTSLSVVFVK